MEEEEVEAVTNLNRWEFFPSPSFLLLLFFSVQALLHVQHVHGAAEDQ